MSQQQVYGQQPVCHMPENCIDTKNTVQNYQTTFLSITFTTAIICNRKLSRVNIAPTVVHANLNNPRTL